MVEKVSTELLCSSFYFSEITSNRNRWVSLCVTNNLLEGYSMLKPHWKQIYGT